MRIVVIGGAGAMGRITVRDLAETAPAGIELVVADRDAAAARRVTRGLRRRVKVVEADATVPGSLARALNGAAAAINACHHDLNLRVMDAALAARAHYCDLGGLFHMTRHQLARDKEFRRAGLLALCGIGSAPGIVNVMASAGARGLDRVEEVHIAVGTHDGGAAHDGLLDTSYSIQTVLDEASQPAALFTGGKMTFVEPLSGAAPVRFPRPVGLQYPALTLHSELATLPGFFRGVREVSFRIAFPGGLADRLRFVRNLGLTSWLAVRVGEQRIVPRELLLALLAAAPKANGAGSHDQYEVLRVVIRGRERRRHIERVLDCHVPGMPAWNVGVDIDTGAPPSIVTQMVLAGMITARGVLPPERAVPVVPFFRALRQRGMRIVRHR